MNIEFEEINDGPNEENPVKRKSSKKSLPSKSQKKIKLITTTAG
jgi:hypothetical protein